ncbi:hypothetical protein Tco_0708572 [Tanacetum coccineum]
MLLRDFSFIFHSSFYFNRSGLFIFEVVAPLLVELHLLLKEESDILWKLALLFPDLKVMVPVSNLIVALAIVRNGVPKMKGLFCVLIDSFPAPFSAPFIASAFLTGISILGDRVYVLGYEEFGFFPYQYFLRGSASREFLKKPEHFSHPTVDFLVLLEDGFLKSFHSPVGRFRDALRCSDNLDWFDEFLCVILAFMVIEGKVINDFPGFVGILIAEFSAGGAVNLALKMKGYMIKKKLDLKPTINAVMRDLLD